MALATIGELFDLLGLPLPAESSADYKRASANLKHAGILVTQATRDWSEFETIPDVVNLVTLQAAARAFRNPEGAIQRGMGPFQEQFSEAGVYLTDPELKLLSRFEAPPTGGIISVPIRRMGDFTHRGCEYAWVPGSDEPIPYFPEGWCGCSP